jgi:hypothetical protein
VLDSRFCWWFGCWKTSLNGGDIGSKTYQVLLATYLYLKKNYWRPILSLIGTVLFISQ